MEKRVNGRLSCSSFSYLCSCLMGLLPLGKSRKRLDPFFAGTSPLKFLSFLHDKMWWSPCVIRNFLPFACKRFRDAVSPPVLAATCSHHLEAPACRLLAVDKMSHSLRVDWRPASADPMQSSSLSALSLPSCPLLWALLFGLCCHGAVRPVRGFTCSILCSLHRGQLTGLRVGDAKRALYDCSRMDWRSGFSSSVWRPLGCFYQVTHLEEISAVDFCWSLCPFFDHF